MILLFHSLCVVGRIFYHVLCDKLFGDRYFINDINVHLEPRDYKYKNYILSKRCVLEIKALTLPETENLVCRFDEVAGLKFFPPAYVQRYNAVKEILTSERWRGKLKKVLDAGCSELGFFPFLKNTPGIEEILALDVDEELLLNVSHRAAPLLVDHLSTRTSPFCVKVLAGSIGQPDPCLKGCDAVIAIELIEHLYPSDLEEVPYSVFGFIRPMVAFFTTPNVDFNVLFGSMRGFRHPDHKFEWSRVQFQDWAMNIVERFPDYEVAFKGIGEGPFGSEHFGCCSQMAIFTKRNLQENESGELEVLSSINDSEPDLAESLHPQGHYKVIEDYEYPVYVDSRTERQKMEDTAYCFISNVASKLKSEKVRRNEELYEQYLQTNQYPDEEDTDDVYISLEEISNALEYQATEDQLRSLLEEFGWKVENHLGMLCVNYTVYENRYSQSSEEEELHEVDETPVKESSLSEKAESDWDNDDKDWCPAAQNISPEPSWESDWNEDDTQARANVDSGYPNSFSAQDKDLANSADLHGSSLEEDSEDGIEEDLANAFPPMERLQAVQPLQNDNRNNMNHINAAPVHHVFYEVEGNQDENQDVVNNNCDNEGNNAEAIFGLDDAEEPNLNIEDGSESEGDAADPVSEDESDVEVEEAGLEDEAELVERLLHQAQFPRRHSREPNDLQHNRPTNQNPPAVLDANHLGGAGDAWNVAPAPLPADLDQDEGFAEVMAGPAIAVEPVDEGGGGEPSPF